MTVVLLGPGDFAEFDLLAGAVRERGCEARLLNVLDWPSDVPLTFDVGSETITAGSEVRLDDVTGVFAWPHMMFRPALSRFADDLREHGLDRTSQVLDAWQGVFNSLLPLFERRGASVFFPPRTQHFHDTKPLQLTRFAQADVPVPDTLFTNDRARVREFVGEHGEVVYKPIAGNAAPGRLSEEDLDDAPLQRLANAPVQFQAFVPGEDVRAYVLDGELVGASRYVTDAWSFKTLDGDPGDAEAVSLRSEARSAVERAADRSPMRFGAADLRYAEESFALLEMNPYPRFAFHDLAGATDIAGALADRLTD